MQWLYRLLSVVDEQGLNAARRFLLGSGQLCNVGEECTTRRNEKGQSRISNKWIEVSISPCPPGDDDRLLRPSSLAVLVVVERSPLGSVDYADSFVRTPADADATTVSTSPGASPMSSRLVLVLCCCLFAYGSALELTADADLRLRTLLARTERRERLERGPFRRVGHGGCQFGPPEMLEGALVRGAPNWAVGSEAGFGDGVGWQRPSAIRTGVLREFSESITVDLAASDRPPPVEAARSRLYEGGKRSRRLGKRGRRTRTQGPCGLERRDSAARKSQRLARHATGTGAELAARRGVERDEDVAFHVLLTFSFCARSPSAPSDGERALLPLLPRSEQLPRWLRLRQLTSSTGP
jgi:hypothetical protein